MEQKQIDGSEVTARYAAFMKATGHTERSVLVNVEFICWVRRKWAEWGKAFNRAPQARNEADHAHFDAWLTAGGAA